MVDLLCSLYTNNSAMNINNLEDPEFLIIFIP